MATIPVVTFGQTPDFIEATATSSAATDKLRNSGLTMLYVRNNGAGPRTITVKEQRPCNYGHAAVHHTTVVAAGDEVRVGTFRRDRYNSKYGELEIWADTAAAINLIEYAGVEVPKEMGR